MADLATIHDLVAKDPDDADFSLQTSPIGIHLEITRGINEPPAARGVDQVVPHRTGRIPRARVNDVLQLELEGFVLAIPDADDDPDGGISFRTQMAELRAVFARNRDPWVLTGVLEDGSTATINVRCTDYAAPEPVSGQVAEPKIALESVDPDWVITPAP